jgi:hypothetical protein
MRPLVRPDASAARPKVRGADDLRPGDDYDRRGPDWAEILAPHGWACAATVVAERRWRRPGKDRGWSATTGHCSGKDGADLLRVFSSSAEPFEDGKSYGRFRAYALLNHGGDLSAAASDLARQGYGAPRAQGKGVASKKEAPAEPAPWEVPVPLNELPEVPEFPVGVLPSALRAFVCEAADALPCPPDYLAVPLLVMAGGAIGASRMLAVKSGYLQSAALYATVIGSPGTAKTPAQNMVVAEANAEAERLHAEWEDLLKVWDEDSCRRRQQVKEWEKGGAVGAKPAAPPRPTLRRVTVGDATTEDLACILNENPRGVVQVRDEQAGWMLAMNQYREGGRGTDRQFYLSAWSGVVAEVDRKSRHELGPVRVAHPFLAAVGGLVPRNLPVLRGDGGRHKGADDGWLDRMLFCYPVEIDASEETWLEVDDATVEGMRDVLATLRKLEMVAQEKGGVTKPRPFVIGMDASAKRTYQDFTRAHADELKDPTFPPYLRGPWSKLRGYCARLALIVHYLRWAAGEGATEKGSLDGESMARAVELVAYFKDHARKVYAALETDPRVRPARRVLDWAYSHHRAQISKRDAYRAARGEGVAKPEDIDTVLELLERNGWIRPAPSTDEPRRRGRPTAICELYPLDSGQNGQNAQG